MEAPRYFAVAPWPRSLKISSSLGTVLLLAICVASYRAIPVPIGFTHYFGLGISLVLPVLLVVSFLATITGYVVSTTDLAIQRILWVTHVPLVGLRRVYLDPGICKGAVRVIGNAGLFGFTGLYRSRQLGRFRLFATDLSQSVVLVLPGRTVVITPAAAVTFVEHIQHIFPATRESTG
jgi:hypothetical protein